MKPAMKKMIAYADGASRGNPGPASFGVVLQNEEGQTIQEISEAIGVNTNNVAEYHALRRALIEAQKLQAKCVDVFSDSELVVKQFNGVYRVKHPQMLQLWSEVQALAKKFQQVRVQHVPRSSHPGNTRADQLANMALDRLRKTVL